jgi:hypothetical protein
MFSTTNWSCLKKNEKKIIIEVCNNIMELKHNCCYNFICNNYFQNKDCFNLVISTLPSI